MGNSSSVAKFPPIFLFLMKKSIKIIHAPLFKKQKTLYNME